MDRDLTDWTIRAAIEGGDPAQARAVDVLRSFFRERSEQVFFSRQVEVIHEGEFFHWVTNRAIRELETAGEIASDLRRLKTGGEIKVLWSRSFRYYKRAASQVVRLVELYSNPNIGAALGLHGEMMVLEGFARHQFVLRGRAVRELDGASWTETEHNMDLVFERDRIKYGIEVKNTLGYMEHEEFLTKIRLCLALDIRPVFAVRMIPKTWIEQLWRAGGYAMIMKYQLYPWTHADLARRVATEFQLPVDAPRALAEGTMTRFLRFHQRIGVNLETNSQ